MTSPKRSLVSVTYIIFVSFVNEMLGLIISVIHLSWKDPLSYFTGIKKTILK